MKGVCCAVLGLSVAVCGAHADRRPVHVEGSTSSATIKQGTNYRAISSRAPLQAYYQNLETYFLKQGHLRNDSNARGVNWNSDTLIRNFIQIAMHSEYGSKSGMFYSMQAEGVLRRWKDPIRISTVYGKSISPTLKQSFSEDISHTVSILRNATRHNVSFSNKNPNFLMIVVNDTERRNLRPFLNKVAPQLSGPGLRAILKMPKNVMCMVLARPHDDPRYGYKGAIVIVRAEHTPRMRRSCIQEEMAQAMGLPNDSDAARPSIFNDNEEFGVLTNHDLMLLRMLYDPRLKPGMTIEQVTPILPKVTKAALNR
nr:DUF2927 domain-containing protein [Sulfitobacter algicola]